MSLDMQTDCVQTAGMKNTTVRGIPDEVFAEIQRQATRSRRSVNAQMVYILERGATPPITATRAVHHINGNSRDNRPENLEVVDLDAHVRPAASTEAE